MRQLQPLDAKSSGDLAGPHLASVHPFTISTYKREPHPIGGLAFVPELGFTPTEAQKNDPALLGAAVLTHLKARADAARAAGPGQRRVAARPVVQLHRHRAVTRPAGKADRRFADVGKEPGNRRSPLCVRSDQSDMAKRRAGEPSARAGVARTVAGRRIGRGVSLTRTTQDFILGYATDRPPDSYRVDGPRREAAIQAMVRLGDRSP